MASIIRHTAVWTGTPGLPGYSQFYTSINTGQAAAAQAGHTAVHDFFEDLVTLIPDAITVTVDPIYQVLVDTTGVIIGEETVGTASAAVTGTFVGAWQAQVGVLVEWTTGLYLNGKRLRGRTYLVPLGNAADTNGTLPTGTLGTVGGAADTLAASDADFAVWHRPVSGSGGITVDVTGGVVRDHAAILRSRMA